MMLSTFFSLDEMTLSQTAVREGIDNTPKGQTLVNLTNTAVQLDKVRRLLGRPVMVSSGYRCLELNRRIGSKDNSDHVNGLSADLTCPGFGTPKEVFEKIRNSGLEFDQLILEMGRWVHIGFGARMRRECLTYDGKSYIEVK